ncbi:MAG: histidine kinase N-terminal 7TM domain-containing protein, partial [bacterium]|nr:histidine kinase N-terminal 7TM domain-containing protein [bacterium]
MIPALSLDIPNLIIIIVAILHAALGLAILLQGASRRENLIFAILELNLVAWSISMVFYRSSPGPEIVFWVKALYLSALLIPYSFIYFVYSFPYKELNKWPRWLHALILLPLLFLILAILGNKLILGVGPAKPEPIIYFNKTFEYLYVLYIVGYFSWSYLRLGHLYLISSGVVKTQIRYVLVGTLVSTLAATPPNLFLPLFGIFALNWLGQVVIIIMAITIAYAISRHNLLNIKVIATEIFSGLIILILLGELLLTESVTEFLGRLFVLTLIIIFSYFLIRSVFQEIRLREEIEHLADNLKKA